jgi:hypothetical protein
MSDTLDGLMEDRSIRAAGFRAPRDSDRRDLHRGLHIGPHFAAAAR